LQAFSDPHAGAVQQLRQQQMFAFHAAENGRDFILR
jgi:hypothetical protein